MIARVIIVIPFNILMAIDEEFIVKSMEISGYKIFFFPPGRDSDLVTRKEPINLKVNEKKALFYNFIHLEFQKDDFDRTASDDPQKNFVTDPPFDLIDQVLNFFLMRLRWVTQASQIHPINLKSNQWRIDYLNDDRTELPKEKGKCKVKLAIKNEFQYSIINNEIWDDIFSVPYASFHSPWEDLLFDAKDQLPQIGPSMVLASTALEIFIPNILNQLVKENGIPDDMWQYFTDRKDWKQNPSVEDQYDILLKILTGHSLKNTDLWTGFRNVRIARNKFVHEGIARIGGGSTEPLTEQQAIDLIENTKKIFLQIHEWLPQKIQWEQHKHYHLKSYAEFPLMKIAK